MPADNDTEHRALPYRRETLYLNTVCIWCGNLKLLAEEKSVNSRLVYPSPLAHTTCLVPVVVKGWRRPDVIHMFSLRCIAYIMMASLWSASSLVARALQVVIHHAALKYCCMLLTCAVANCQYNPRTRLRPHLHTALEERSFRLLLPGTHIYLICAYVISFKNFLVHCTSSCLNINFICMQTLKDTWT